MTQRTTNPVQAVKWALVGAVMTAAIGVLLWRSFGMPAGRSESGVATAVTWEPQPRSERDHEAIMENTRAHVEPEAPAVASIEPPAPMAPKPRVATRLESRQVWSSIRRCLLDPEINPNDLKCTSEDARRELERMLGDLISQRLELLEARKQIQDQIAVAKIENGIDPKETWDTIPEDEVVAKSWCTRYVDGKVVQGATVIRKGQHPELDELLKRIDDQETEARAKLRDRIIELCAD